MNSAAGGALITHGQIPLPLWVKQPSLPCEMRQAVEARHDKLPARLSGGLKGALRSLPFYSPPPKKQFPISNI